MSNSIRRVTLEIETSNGEYHKLVVAQPAPIGDNPRFMAQQLDSAIAELRGRADELMETYGSQVQPA